MDLATLSWPELTAARRQVMACLIAASGRADACSLLGVSPGLADQVAANLQLEQLPALKASELYTGVLFDALDLASLSAAEQRRARASVVIFSALHGVVTLSDRISLYRLSAGVSLPEIGSVTAYWRGHLTPLNAHAQAQVVIDCRSGGYRTMWRPPEVERWLRVDVPGASHHAKHTRGLVARALLQTSGRLRVVDQVAAALTARGELFSEVDLIDEGKRGWRLLVTPTATPERANNSRAVTR